MTPPIDPPGPQCVWSLAVKVNSFEPQPARYPLMKSNNINLLHSFASRLSLLPHSVFHGRATTMTTTTTCIPLHPSLSLTNSHVATNCHVASRRSSRSWPGFVQLQPHIVVHCGSVHHITASIRKRLLLHVCDCLTRLARSWPQTCENTLGQSYDSCEEFYGRQIIGTVLS